MMSPHWLSMSGRRQRIKSCLQPNAAGQGCGAERSIPCAGVFEGLSFLCVNAPKANTMNDVHMMRAENRIVLKRRMASGSCFIHFGVANNHRHDTLAFAKDDAKPFPKGNSTTS